MKEKPKLHPKRMEEYTLVWLPRNRRKALKLKVSGSEYQTNDNQHKINCKSKQNTDKFLLGQPKGDWIWNPFQFRRLGEEIGSSQVSVAGQFLCT